jgi:hypothetical protein
VQCAIGVHHHLRHIRRIGEDGRVELLILLLALRENRAAGNNAGRKHAEGVSAGDQLYHGILLIGR